MLERERDESARRREDVEGDDRAPLVDAERDEAVREVIAAAAHRAAAREAPRHAHERRVENRDKEDEQRDRCNRHDARLELGRGEQRRAAQERTQEQASAVTHEDGGRPDVVDKEAERRTDERGHRGGKRDGASGRERGKEEDAGHGGNARRQPVDVVEQVERVGDAHDPDERQQRIQRDDSGEARGRHQEHDDAGHDRLHDELGRRAEVKDVVEGPEREHQARRDEERHERHERCAQHRRDCERGRHRAAAEQRDGFPMPAIAMRPGEGANPMRERSTKRSQGCREGEASEQGEQYRSVHEWARVVESSQNTRRSKGLERIHQPSRQTHAQNPPRRRLSPRTMRAGVSRATRSSCRRERFEPLVSLKRLPSNAEWLLQNRGSISEPSSASVTRRT